ncbi:SURF1 family protein [Corynebacterium pygosceleis]|uniref:SURF1-like protein n=1 Tax=Corynebacterium pygosceleis TaxID=2800406 RepID=A0A9Q4C713_9CORY|nr:SURF1 family protein [Corynebacterium pygosceleis]MCK7636570.1 SURF1 family protein [Corynebacterium pygosceleis]MCK7675144.1 SURF1 family protein [Corynebacterium pygosceleis]MCL0120639.1 SURF1 family protein [Corynebacterium pygosceleis]MCX7467323.1 SURF1 family protein [Corynebacterium pygosceleis]
MNAEAVRPGGSKGPMSVLRGFLTPGWVITAVVVIVFAYTAFTVLAPWQLGKNEATSARNQRIEEAFNTDPVPLGTLVGTDGVVDPDLEWRRVTLTGRYLPDEEVLLRLRPVDHQPAVQGLVPFELDDGTVVLVNRGWLPVSAGTIPEVTPAPGGEVTVSGYLRRDEAVPERSPVTEQGHTQVHGISTAQISELTGVQLGRDYIQLAEGSPGGLDPIPLPKLDAGPYLSYGVQWIAFGVMAPLGLGYFIWAELRERRREREERASTAAVDTGTGTSAAVDPSPRPEPEEPSVDGDPATDAPDAAPPQRPRHNRPRRRARYGSGHTDYYRTIAEKNEERF